MKIRSLILVVMLGAAVFYIYGTAQIPTAAATPVTAKGLTVSGTVLYHHAGDLFVALARKNDFYNDAAVKHKQVLTIDPANKSVDFKFTHVEPGVFALRVFQDINGNGKLDIGWFGPTEPVAVYRESHNLFGPPNFDDICFEVKTDLAGIRIDCK